MFKDPSSPVKASNFNTLNPDLLTLYLRPSPIKIWPTYAVPPTTTLYPRSTYDLWRAGSSPTIFQPVEKLIPLTTTSQSGPDQPPLYFRPTYALPDQGPLIADPSIFPERERAGVDRVSGVNGPLVILFIILPKLFITCIYKKKYIHIEHEILIKQIKFILKLVSTM